MIMIEPSEVEKAAFSIEDHLLPRNGVEGEIMHTLARWADAILDFFGMEHDPHVAVIFYSLLVFGISVGVGMVCRYVLVWIIKLFFEHSRNEFVRIMLAKRLISSVTSLIPPLCYFTLLHITYLQDASLMHFLTKVTLLYIIYRTVVACNRFADVIWIYIDERQNKRKLPLKSLDQLAKGIIWLIGIIIAISLLVNKSPGALLAGLGAFAAVLMLVFRDSILGVVAGVQLSEEDALHVGDWIKVGGTDANGIVEEANLVSVKVKNWDNTTTLVPPHSLVSGSFTNYRSMFESKSRRIYRYYYIDTGSISPLQEKDLDKYRSIPYMDKWITAKLRQKAAGREYNADNPEELADGSLETNLGLFRAYLKMYLDDSKDIDHSQMCFVGTMQQEGNGMPLFVYCFTNTASWVPYTAIQSAMFEHIAVVLDKFNLATLDTVTGRDLLGTGYIMAGNDPKKLYGLPDPFYVDDQSTIPVGARSANNSGGGATSAHAEQAEK